MHAVRISDAGEGFDAVGVYSLFGINRVKIVPRNFRKNLTKLITKLTIDASFEVKNVHKRTF